MPQPDHNRDHIDFETEPCAQWYEIKMDTVIFKLLQTTGCLSSDVSELPGDGQCISRGCCEPHHTHPESGEPGSAHSADINMIA